MKAADSLDAPPTGSPVDLGAFLGVIVDARVESRLNQLAERIASLVLGQIGSTAGNRVLGVAEAAAYLGLSERTVYKRAEQGTLPSVKDGGRLLFRLTDLDAYVQARVVSRERSSKLAGELSRDTLAPNKRMWYKARQNGEADQGPEAGLPHGPHQRRGRHRSARADEGDRLVGRGSHPPPHPPGPVRPETHERPAPLVAAVLSVSS
jgi:excisionase family DNA binding protein